MKKKVNIEPLTQRSPLIPKNVALCVHSPCTHLYGTIAFLASTIDRAIVTFTLQDFDNAFVSNCR
jgi:uncharacterized membrane protein